MDSDLSPQPGDSSSTAPFDSVPSPSSPHTSEISFITPESTSGDCEDAEIGTEEQAVEGVGRGGTLKGKEREPVSHEGTQTGSERDGTDSTSKGKERVVTATQDQSGQEEDDVGTREILCQSTSLSQDSSISPSIPSSTTSIVHPRPRTLSQQSIPAEPVSYTSPAHSPPTTPRSKRKGRFSRSISQLSLSSLKSLPRSSTPSRPGTPSESLVYEGEPPRQAESRDRVSKKEKLRDFFRVDSNKAQRSISRPTTPVRDREDIVRPILPSLDRVRSRGRSNSAPSLMNWPHSPVQPFLWNPSPTATPLTNDSPQQTPFHSAVSSPLSIYFAFPPELEHQSTKEEPKVDVFAHYPPLELQIRVMKALLEVCEEDWRREVREGSWKGAKARERWSEGEARGRRELARVGRVSRSWKKLSLDSQLWANGPATASIGADALDVKSIVSLFDQSGPAIQRLDLQGFGKSLTSKLLRQITEGASTDGCTNLTSINLRGCNSLSSRSITNLLISSPHLVDIDLFALYQVRSSHLEILASRCEHLESLNVSRCRNLPASSLLVLCDNPPPRRRLKSLFISALPGMTNDILVELWTNLPALSSLDISFSPHLTDDAFKRLTTDHAYPSLRSLNLAGCTSLTSLSLSYFVVNRTIPSTSLLPSLEQLELSRLSPSFDAGDHLSSFLESVRPTLKKLDLEDGINLTDSVLQSLKGSNSRLETLLLNSCSRFTDEAILEVVRECKRLKVLEVDGTEVSDSTAKEFVRLVSERQERGNQEGTEEKGGGRPKVLSILDNRLTGRRLHREIGTSSIRPRIGYRGWWTGDAVGFYHDGNEENTVDGEESEEPWKKRLEECDEERIVVRSFYSSLEVDAANAARRAREENRVKAKDSKGGGLLRIRAMSDSVLSANSARVGGGENGHEGEGDGNSSTATGCLVM